MEYVKTKRQQIEKFLIKEAALLDQDLLNDWLDLFTDELIYWIPSGSSDINPMKHVSIIYDDRIRLEERVKRLQSGLAYGQEPKSKTCHLITNIEVDTDENEKIVVFSNFLIVELRRSIQTIYSGRNEHHLVHIGDDLKIQYKKIDLLNKNEYIGNLSFIL
ncbi:aromatic-ring-hydroxylating dioxygenase subunit beta [Domibacillus epiphyticus]|uniref:Aromatic-ring-hydroxylating dioxygenase subunit beta n=1 Tax=Domibacillus epiphyticus TaxID=1714355 RepID=A0A1V2A8T8_9BACI|nr:aromatic-ring-hydroxylating dioxygenase subunit beta [Domibacillus epiphyticus]OMP67272.1 hypothetical protein BTO28_08065 [Domibacillus epiphyticus]